MGPTISVIIPVYNVEAYLQQCLDSIVNQTYDNLDIIIIDNNSTDRSGELCDEYERVDKRIRVIHKKNEGVGVSRNLGIDQAIGEWITFVDSDDWCDLDYIEKILESVSHPCADIILGGGYIEEYSSQQIIVRHFNTSGLNKTMGFQKLLITNMLVPHIHTEEIQNGNRLGVIWNKLYSASFLQGNNIRFSVNIEPGMDTIFNMKAFNMAGVIGFCKYIGYHYRNDNPISVTNRFLPNLIRTGIDYMDEIIKINERGHIKLKKDIIYAKVVRQVGIALQSYFFHPDNDKPYCIIAEEIKTYKKKAIIYEAIYRKNNQFLTKKQIVLKYFLRLPWILPLKVLCFANQNIKE